jgi:hypothetical protein
MKASDLVLLAALIVLLGRWANGKSVKASEVVGGLFAALVIGLLDNGSGHKLAMAFAWLFVVGGSLSALEPILKNTGVVTK